MIGINSDTDLKKTREVVKEKEITWRSFWNGPLGTSGPISETWNVGTWPTGYVIDAKGIIRFKNLHGEKLNQAIDKLLAEKQDSEGEKPMPVEKNEADDVKKAKDTIPFDLVYKYEGLTDAQAATIAKIEKNIESLVPGYRNGVDKDGKQVVKKLEIELVFEEFDGKGRAKAASKIVGMKTSKDRILPTSGWIKFDTADMEPGSKLQMVTLVHETFHIMGFGNLWGMSPVRVLNAEGQYTQRSAVTAYREEFGNPNAKVVPVETEGGRGTDLSHWDEANGGKEDTGIVSNISGKDLRHEVMTGWITEEAFISNMTLKALEHVGYETLQFEAQDETTGKPDGQISPHVADWFK